MSLILGLWNGRLGSLKLFGCSVVLFGLAFAFSSIYC